MSPRDEDSGVYLIKPEEVGEIEEGIEVPPTLLDRHGWTPAMMAERDRLIRRAIEDEFQRMSEHPDPMVRERLDVSMYIVDQKRMLNSLGNSIRWQELTARIKHLQEMAGVPEELRIEGKLWDLADFLGQVRHEWLTGRIQRRMEERRRLALKSSKLDYTREELCACTDPRSHAGLRKDIIAFEELRYQTLIKSAAAIKAA